MSRKMKPNPNPMYEKRLVFRGDTFQDRKDVKSSRITTRLVAKMIHLTKSLNDRFFLLLARIEKFLFFI